MVSQNERVGNDLCVIPQTIPQIRQIGLTHRTVPCVRIPCVRKSGPVQHLKYTHCYGILFIGKINEYISLNRYKELEVLYEKRYNE